MSETALPSCPAPSSLLPHSGGMLLLSSVLGWSESELVGRIDVRADSYLASANGVAGSVATEYLAQCSAALFTLLALSNETLAQPRMGMLIASRSLSLSAPQFEFGALLGTVQAQSSLPAESSPDGILVRFAGTLSTLNPADPMDEIMIQHEPGAAAMPMSVLRERAANTIAAKAEFSVYLPAIEATEART